MIFIEDFTRITSTSTSIQDLSGNNNWLYPHDHVPIEDSIELIHVYEQELLAMKILNIVGKHITQYIRDNNIPLLKVYNKNNQYVHFVRTNVLWEPLRCYDILVPTNPDATKPGTRLFIPHRYIKESSHDLNNKPYSSRIDLITEKMINDRSTRPTGKPVETDPLTITYSELRKLMNGKFNITNSNG